LLSVFVEGKLYALLALGSDQRICFNTQNTETYRNFAGFLSTTLEKLKTNEAIGQRLTVLERLDSVNRSISAVTDVDHLYQAIHQQMTASLGDINFLIALYDADTNQIEIPYAFEEDHLINIPPFPLGEGLTSILIKTRQPLMIVEDTERQAVELGAKTVGQPAKSWLGVPLIVGGDVIGALIVQDLEREHRFDEEDKRMLNMLSTQVAISLRNAHLLRESQIRVEREQVITELTNKLWASTDVETILRTALMELGRTMSVSRGFIQLDMSEQTRNVN
jgi:GAF domain-containing protein